MNTKTLQNEIAPETQIARFLIVAMIGLAAIIAWRITVPVAMLIALIVAGRKYHQAMLDPNRIIVNRYSDSQLYRKFKQVMGYRQGKNEWK
jgi:hypothetical protein